MEILATLAALVICLALTSIYVTSYRQAPVPLNSVILLIILGLAVTDVIFISRVIGWLMNHT